MSKPYKAKSLSAAQAAVRRLRRQIAERDELLTRFDRERRLMARLAAETPQFFNPLVAMEAKQIRDRLLGLPNAPAEAAATAGRLGPDVGGTDGGER
jgi:hypothetical protein